MGETKSIVAVVLDAGPIIHLDELSALELLSEFPAIYVPEAVWVEVEQHRREALTRPGVTLLRIGVKLDEDPTLSVLVQVLSLGAGEHEALQLARQYPGAVLLTDDAAARLAAEALGLRVHGTLGILVRAPRRGQRTAGELVALLRQLPEISSLHVRRDLLEQVIVQVKQTYGLA